MSGPSGAGKTSIAAGVLRRRPDIVLSVSSTTRAPRAGERDGVDYRFLSEDAFDDLASSGGFLEHARVHGNRYGTPRAPVEAALAQGKTVLLEIDVQGARAIRRAVPDAVLVFVEPPSREVLRERLHRRQTEDDASFSLRMANAEHELEAAAEFDHRVVNDDLEAAVGEVLRILDAET
ncbi:MAG: guanylate kinase [Actinomycetota bacterium]